MFYKQMCTKYLTETALGNLGFRRNLGISGIIDNHLWFWARASSNLSDRWDKYPFFGVTGFFKEIQKVARSHIKRKNHESTFWSITKRKSNNKDNVLQSFFDLCTEVG
jgi:hypothetical protein